jgi:hypothetical protein
VDRRGEFTNHCVEIFEDGKYKSFARGGKEIEGEYTINFKDTEIVFLNKTSFGQNLRYVRRGNIFTLEAEMGAREWRFKKISEGMAEPTADEVPLNGNGEKETGKDVNDANQ